MGYKELDSRNNNETKHPLNSGIPCKIHSCSKCCVDTHMSLTGIDIKRISNLGYRYRDFVIRRKRERYLKNHNGKCFFLGDNGCKIYSSRPDGCRLYPLVYNENTGQAIIHDFCQYGNMFKVSRGDVENLHSLIKKLKRE
jgi:Fe-S-cluster containining protein